MKLYNIRTIAKKVPSLYQFICNEATVDAAWAPQKTATKMEILADKKYQNLQEIIAESDSNYNLHTDILECTSEDLIKSNSY